MKTYLLDILNRYKRFSETLDVKTILCNKSWLIFNDGGEKEVYIFQEDGSLIISFAGKVTQAKWQYLPVNKSLIISANEDAYMLHPAFVDEKVFALQQDGTDKFAFMIDERQSIDFFPKTLIELTTYFEEKERKKLQEQQMAHQKALEQERINEQKEKEEAWKERLLAEAREKWEMEMDSILGDDLEYARFKKRDLRIKRCIKVLFVIGMICVAVGILGIWGMDGMLWYPFIIGVVLLYLVLMFFVSSISGAIDIDKSSSYRKHIEQKYINDYIQKTHRK